MAPPGTDITATMYGRLTELGELAGHFASTRVRITLPPTIPSGMFAVGA